MKTYVIKLITLSTSHKFPSSDTLFGAICWCIKRLHGNEFLEQILAEIDKNPLFILSSSFPLIVNRDNKSIYFFPKPITSGITSCEIEALAGNDKKDQIFVITEYKKYKKAEYISESLFSQIKNHVAEKSLLEKYLDGKILLTNGMLLTKEESEEGDIKKRKLFIKTTIQKNSLDRLSMSTGEEGQTFYQQEIFTNQKFALYFLIKTADIDFFVPLFKYLEDKGIGGNRSTGKGRFKIKIIEEKDLSYDTQISTFVSLSRFIPSNTEINFDSNKNYYEILPYRSKVDSEFEFKGTDIWKDKIMYFKEGSVFEAKENKSFYGKCPIVKEIEEKKIRQYGLAFPIFGSFGGEE